jgi:hypothetical protein
MGHYNQNDEYYDHLKELRKIEIDHIKSLLDNDKLNLEEMRFFKDVIRNISGYRGFLNNIKRLLLLK